MTRHAYRVLSILGDLKAARRGPTPWGTGYCAGTLTAAWPGCCAGTLTAAWPGCCAAFSGPEPTGGQARVLRSRDNAGHG
jgi:hypothetical protein